jgi:hypothetical protein
VTNIIKQIKRQKDIVT